MGISFGSASKKPYVGSKEVKEAYVGTQKVYSAAPPVYYAFLGTATGYEKADWCELTTGASIKQRGGVNCIGIKGNFSTGEYNIITLKEIKGTILRFEAASDGSTTSDKYPVLSWRNSSNGVIRADTFNPRPNGGQFGLIEFTVPSGAAWCTIGAIRSSSGYVYLNAIRFEMV